MGNEKRYIDVDGHILERHGLWEDYIEPKYRARALKILEDEEGLEYLSVDGQPSWFFRGGTLGALGAIGQDVQPFREPGRIKWEDPILPRGGYDPHERVKVMDAEGIDQTLVYPSLGLGWEEQCADIELAAANCRAYNNWLFDFCKARPDRLIPVAHITTLDVDEAVKELRRTARLGAKAAMIEGTCPSRRAFGSRYFDPLWKEAEGIGIPVTIHPVGAVPDCLYPNKEDCTSWWIFALGGEIIKFQFTTFLNEGTFERFPKLKLVILESSTGWLVPWLQRLDSKFDLYGFTTPMKMLPSEYFLRNCWIAMDPDEEMVHFNVEHLDDSRILWAYDYPHSDSVTDPVKKLDENLAPLPPESRRRIASENAVELYGL